MKIICAALILSLAGIIMLGTGCQPGPRTPKDLSKEALIPLPVSINATGSSFLIGEKGVSINIGEGGEMLSGLGEYLSDLLEPATGFLFPRVTGLSFDEPNQIILDLDDFDELGQEGYELEITENKIHIKANAPAGIFYGMQTLRQLLPATIESKQVQPGPWEVATGVIKDQPSYGYRGAMLDVARHFFNVEEVKKYIDYIAMYKFNALHLHLSDDQGWRIEIKSWPRLAEYGGSKEVGGGKGGYFTQQQYTELVNYASDHFITIVPEIDMPGHTQAALASYPELSCAGKDQELYTGIEVGFSTFCTDKEVVYQFVDDVIRELAAITPGPYIHIGGDESLVTPLDKYIPFVNRVQEIVQSHGKQVIGWDEIAHAKLIPNSVIQYWAEAENGLRGIEQGSKVLMSPAAKTYMDMQYDSTSPLGLHWAAYIEVDAAYNWDPEKMVDGIDREHILGIETPLWSETLEDLKDIEYMAFPRLPGYGEIGWTPSDQRNWDTYKLRLGKQKPRFEALGINFYSSPKVPWGNSPDSQ